MMYDCVEELDVSGGALSVPLRWRHNDGDDGNGDDGDHLGW